MMIPCCVYLKSGVGQRLFGWPRQQRTSAEHSLLYLTNVFSCNVPAMFRNDGM